MNDVWSNNYYATIEIPLEEVKREDQYEKRNRWWQIMFPRYAKINNCHRNPLRSTLGMILAKKFKRATLELMKTLKQDLFGEK